MNDKQDSNPSGDENGQAADTSPTITQTQLSEFITAAKLGCESIKASEDGAQGVVKQLKEILVDAKTEYAKITDAIPKFAAAATEVETQRAAVSAHAQQVDGAQKRVADIRAELDGILVSVKQTQADVDGLKQSAETSKASASQADADVTNIKTTVSTNAEAIAAALAAATSASAKTKSLADKSETIEQRINDYETKLDNLNKRCDDQLDAIKALLPGATSAGLASAFDQRRKTFLNPSKRWQGVFVGSVIFLALIALASLIEVYRHTPPMKFSELLVLWASRLPFAAALVWLAMHASREAALAKRLEEDYGFKASVASSFQGFQEQMKIVGASAAGNEPLKTLCDATLAQITNRPGRIYEKHELTVSPTAELLKAAQTIVDAAKVAKGGQ